MLIDAHQHFWHYEPARDSWITEEMSELRRDFLPAELEAYLTTEGVDGSIAVQADQSEVETEFLVTLASRHSSIIGVVGWLDLRSKDLEQRLDCFGQFKTLCGIRHIAQAEADDFLIRDDVSHGIGLLNQYGLTYDLLVYPQQLPAAISLVEKLPEQRFVLDHMAKPRIKDGLLEPWSTHIRELAYYENVWCKVSGLVTEADWTGWKQEDFFPYWNVVLSAFGPQRLIFGSDWPVCLLAASYASVKRLADTLAANLSASERERFFGGNAIDAYGIAVQPVPE